MLYYFLILPMLDLLTFPTYIMPKGNIYNSIHDYKI